MAEHQILLLGLGFWGSKWLEAVSKRDDCELAGMAAASEQSIDRVAQQFSLPAERGYVGYQEAIDRTDAEIVIIAIPTEYHTDAAKLALARGMHVLSEKPLAANMEQADEILELKQTYPDQKYLVDQNYRWRSHNQTLKRAIAEGMIGQPGTVHIEFRQPEDLLGYREFLEMPLLQDVSIHHFDLVRFLCGCNCQEVFAHSYRPRWSKFPGKPATEAVMRMESGITVNYNGTWAARGRPTSWDGEITVTGDKGCLKLDSQGLVRYFAPGDVGGEIVEPVQMQLTELDYALDMMIRCIEQDDQPETSIEDNYHSLAMVCAAEQSARSNLPVRLA